MYGRVSVSGLSQSLVTMITTLPHMAIMNRFYSLALPFVLIFSIPLAVFAAITTTFAISILLFRVLLIYAELGIAVIPYYLLGHNEQPSLIPELKTPRSHSHSPAAVRRRKRRSSTSSIASDGLTPIASDGNLALMYTLNTSMGPQRDFEGVGGWRLDSPEEEETLWTSINSRLELPAEHVRRHRRSLTSGSRYTSPRSQSPENQRVSGLSMMVRTEPSTSEVRSALEATAEERAPDAYFDGGSQSSISNVTKRMPSAATTGSVSSGSSKGSILTMKRM